MVPDFLLIHIQAQLRLRPLDYCQVGVGKWDGIYNFEKSLGSDLGSQDSNPVVHLREYLGSIPC